MNLKKRAVLALLFFAVLAISLSAYLLTLDVRVKVTVQLSSSVNSVAQIYYDDGHGYDEAHSRTVPVKSTRPGTFQDLQFTFRVRRLRGLRFDPATVPGHFAVRNFQTEADHRPIFTLSPGDLAPLHEISECNIDAQTLNCTTQNDATDPQFLLRLPKKFNHLQLAAAAYWPTLLKSLTFVTLAIIGFFVATGDRTKSAIRRLLLRDRMRAGFRFGGVYILTAFIFLLLFLRRPDSLLNPQLWAEDAIIFFSQDVRFGFWHALLMPHAGYLHTIPRLIAGVSGILPARFVPLSFNLAALIIEAISLSAFAFPCCRKYIRSGEIRAAVCIIAACVIPTGYEMIGTIANIQWLLAIPGLLIMLGSPDKPYSWTVYAGAAAGLLIGSTVPLLIIAVPLVVAAIFTSRKLPPLPALATVAGLATQAAVAAQNVTSGEKSHSLDTIKAVIAAYVSRPILETLCGERFVKTGSDAKLTIAMAIALAIFVAGLIYLLLSSTPAQKLLLAGVLYLSGGSLALALLGRQFVPDFLKVQGWRGFQGQRYFVFPTALFIFLVAFALQRAYASRPIIGMSLLFLIFGYGIEQNFRAPKFIDVKWPLYANKVDAWKRSKRAGAPLQPFDVPINPRPWVLRLD